MWLPKAEGFEGSGGGMELELHRPMWAQLRIINHTALGNRFAKASTANEIIILTRGSVSEMGELTWIDQLPLKFADELRRQEDPRRHVEVPSENEGGSQGRNI